MRPERRHNLPPLPLLIAFLLAGILYAWSAPLFEAPDESWHFAFADHVMRNRSLPVQQPGTDTPWRQQGSQPPLYYALVAALIAGVDTSDLPEHMQLNPHAIVGDPSALDNQNHYLHDYRALEPRGTALAVYVARLFSLLLATGSVAAVWLAARELALLLKCNPRRLSLLAAGLVAFNPQFLFISASVSNDNLITLLSSLTIWQMLAMLRAGMTRRRSLALAALLALASISKLSGLLLLAPVALAALWRTSRSGNWRSLLQLAALAGACWLMIAGPWYARNLALYGEFTGTQTMLDVFGRRPAPSLETLLTEEFTGLRQSYWGIFGWFNIFSPAPLYVAMDLVTLAGAAGLLAWLWQGRKEREALVPVSLLALCFALFAIALVIWTRQTAATQGRLLFPASAASMSLLALGLTTLRAPARLPVAALGIVALAIPFVSIRPAYAPPSVVDGLPADATPLTLRFGDVELLGYRLEQRRLAPGDILPVTLYWRPLRRSQQDFSFFLHVLDSEDHILARRYGYPGGGILRTTRWQPGLVHEDRRVAKLPLDQGGHSRLRVHIGWWKYPDGFAVPGTSADGVKVDPVLLPAGAFSDGRGPGSSPENVIDPIVYGKSIRLLAWELEGSTLALLWEALAAPEPDLHVFIHVHADPLPGEAVTVLVEGDDAPALPTRYWRARERFVTRHHLRTIEPRAVGDFPLRVGWYSTSRHGRLTADCPDNSCPLTTLTLPLQA